VVDWLDPQIEFHAVTGELTNEGRPYVGVEGMRKYFRDVEAIWHELRLSQDSFEPVGDHILITGRAWGRGRDGSVIDSPAGWIWRLRDDKVVSIRVFSSAEEARAASAELPPGAG
jgi:hypothetical protein